MSAASGTYPRLVNYIKMCIIMLPCSLSIEHSSPLLSLNPLFLIEGNKVISNNVVYLFMPAFSESNRIAHEVYEAHLEEIRKRKRDVVVIDIDQRKVLDVLNKDKALTFMQKILCIGISIY